MKKIKDSVLPSRLKKAESTNSNSFSKRKIKKIYFYLGIVSILIYLFLNFILYSVFYYKVFVYLNVISQVLIK
jgi:hypothetical protein